MNHNVAASLVSNPAAGKVSIVISEEQETALVSAYQTIHSILSESHPNMRNVAFNPTDVRILSDIASKGVVALDTLYKHRYQEQMAAVRDAIFALFAEPAREQLAAREEYDALSPALRAKLGAFDDTCALPFTEVRALFAGQNVTDPQIVGLLTSLKFKVAKVNNTPVVIMNLPPRQK